MKAKIFMVEYPYIIFLLSMSFLYIFIKKELKIRTDNADNQNNNAWNEKCYFNRNNCRESACQVNLFLILDFQPFTMSGALLPAVGYMTSS